MSLRPPTDIATYLDANSTALTFGTNLFVGPVRAVSDGVPVQSVFILGSGADPPDRVFGVERELRRPVLQVSVRAATFSAGNSLARSIYGILQSATPDGYKDLSCRQSGPVLTGYNQNTHYVFTYDWDVPYDSDGADGGMLLPWQASE